MGGSLRRSARGMCMVGGDGARRGGWLAGWRSMVRSIRGLRSAGGALPNPICARQASTARRMIPLPAGARSFGRCTCRCGFGSAAGARFAGRVTGGSRRAAAWYS
jgi:hypothetical protein